jgi:alpha-glucosidase
VADESKDPNSVLQFYRQVIKLRHTNKALLDGNYTPINENDPNVLSYLRLYKDQGLVIALNMSSAPQKLTLDLKGSGFVSARELVGTGVLAEQGSEISLQPFGVFIGELSK